MTKKFNCLNPHPKVVAKWREMGFLPNTLRCHDQEETFLASVGNAKVIKFEDPQSEDGKNPRIEPLVVETLEDSQRPIHREIRRFLRVMDAEGEKVCYFEYLRGETFGGDTTDKHRWVGKYEEPQGTKHRDRQTGTITYTGEGEKITRYEIPFGKEKFVDPSTNEQTTLDDLPRGANCMYYVKTPNRLYALSGITFEEYVNSPFSYLVDWGQQGKKPVVAAASAAEKDVTEAPKATTRSKKQE
jgi:hypothetical protein